mgnify:CR=1 FL=1
MFPEPTEQRVARVLAVHEQRMPAFHSQGTHRLRGLPHIAMTREEQEDSAP